MIQHYFDISSVGDDQMKRLDGILGRDDNVWGTLKDKATPAFIEQKCAECSSVNELLDQLEGKHIDKKLFENDSKLDRSYSLSGNFAIERQLSSSKVIRAFTQ